MSLLARISMNNVRRHVVFKQQGDLSMLCVQFSRLLSGSSKSSAEIKRPASSYFLFSNDQRPSVKEKHPELQTVDVSRHIGKMWRDASETEKEAYVQRARILWDEYNSKIQALSPEEQQAMTEAKRTRLARRKLGAKKDNKGRPSRSPSAYNIFYAKEFVEVTEQHPDISFGEKSKKIGEAWRSLSDDAKQLFVEEAKLLKVNYLRDLQIWKESKRKPSK